LVLTRPMSMFEPDRAEVKAVNEGNATCADCDNSVSARCLETETSHPGPWSETFGLSAPDAIQSNEGSRWRLDP
jgi:hypothetical protein